MRQREREREKGAWLCAQIFSVSFMHPHSRDHSGFAVPARQSQVRESSPTCLPQPLVQLRGGIEKPDSIKRQRSMKKTRFGDVTSPSLGAMPIRDRQGPFIGTLTRADPIGKETMDKASAEVKNSNPRRVPSCRTFYQWSSRQQSTTEVVRMNGLSKSKGLPSMRHKRPGSH